MSQKYKLKAIIRLLKFILTLDDLEIIKTTIESVIDTIQEIINSDRDS